MANEEIANFLAQHFQKMSAAEASERVKTFPYTNLKTCQTLWQKEKLIFMSNKVICCRGVKMYLCMFERFNCLLTGIFSTAFSILRIVHSGQIGRIIKCLNDVLYSAF